MLSTIVRDHVHMKMCLVMNSYWERTCWSPRTKSDFCLLGTTLFWVITQQVVAVPKRRFGTTSLSHREASRSIDQGSRSRPLHTRPIGFPETSVRVYRYWLRNDPEERGSHLLRAEAWNLAFCLLGSVKRVYKRKVATPDELFARIVAAAATIKKPEDQLRRTRCDVRSPVAKCIEIDGGIFYRLWWTVTNLSFLCNRFVIYTLN